jgi:predicted Zn-dependent protease
VRRAALGLAALALASAGLAPGASLAQSRPIGLRPAATTDEGGLWDEFDKAEQHVRASGELDSDPALNAYVREVMCKVADDYCHDIRVYVLDRPFFNAQVAANGYAEVWSGLLLRASNEAQLGFVLGHETSHFVENHSVKRLRAQRNNTNVAMILSLGAGLAGVNLVNLVYLGSVAATFSFTREEESQADDLGLKRAAKAGYDPAIAVAIWQAETDEVAASDFEKVRKSEAHGSIFADHPLTRERVAALAAELRTLPAGGEVGRARHRAAIRPHLAAWLADDLRRRDFGETLQVIDRLATDGEDLGVLNFYRGEAYRQRHREDDLPKARDAYLKATAWPDAPVAAWRELGDLRQRDHDAAGARAAYEAYLAKAPDAEDAWIVRDALTGLGKGT